MNEPAHLLIFDDEYKDLSIDQKMAHKEMSYAKKTHNQCFKLCLNIGV